MAGTRHEMRFVLTAGLFPGSTQQCGCAPLPRIRQGRAVAPLGPPGTTRSRFCDPGSHRSAGAAPISARPPRWVWAMTECRGASTATARSSGATARRRRVRRQRTPPAAGNRRRRYHYPTPPPPSPSLSPLPTTHDIPPISLLRASQEGVEAQHRAWLRHHFGGAYAADERAAGAHVVPQREVPSHLVLIRRTAAGLYAAAAATRVLRPVASDPHGRVKVVRVPARAATLARTLVVLRTTCSAPQKAL